jgi:hypothetical protein
MINIHQMCSREDLTAWNLLWNIGNVPKVVLVGECTGVKGTLVTTKSPANFLGTCWSGKAQWLTEIGGDVSEHLHELYYRHAEAGFATCRGRELTGGAGVIRIL